MIIQYDAAGNVVSSITDGTPGDQFDQASEDGKGHLFVASNNNGNVLFDDYDASGKIAVGFKTEAFLHAQLDDIAPLSGSGGPTVPEPTSILLFGTVLAGVATAFRRRSA